MLGLNSMTSSVVVGTIVALVIVLDNLIPAALALRTTKGSPCADVCHKTSTNTTSSEIVCLDSLYNTTATGSDFQKCVECELRSTYRDSSSGESDVMWGIYNLRYAFSSCVYGYPEQVANISSPCSVVSCESLGPALRHDLTHPSPANFNSSCNLKAFADNSVTKCEFCYNMTINQIYLANFVESVRYNCHYKTPENAAFAINPDRIFKQLALPPSDPNKSKSSSGSSVAKNLTIIIVIPILVGITLIAAITICCIFVIRRRRKQNKRRHEAAQLQALWDEATTPIPQSWGTHSSNSPSDQGTLTSTGYGFGSHDVDGVHRQDTAYPKPTATNLVEITEPAASVQATSHNHPQEGKDNSY